MPDKVQTLKNHARLLPPFHLFVLPVLLVNLLNAFRHIYLSPSLSTTWAAIVAAALLVLAFLARIQPLTVQDRLIRLEMRLRLEEVLPPDPPAADPGAHAEAADRDAVRERRRTPGADARNPRGPARFVEGHQGARQRLAGGLAARLTR